MQTKSDSLMTKLVNRWKLFKAQHAHQYQHMVMVLYIILATLLGAIGSYAFARINFIDAYNKQEVRHIADILAVRDAYGGKASEIRQASIEQAKSSSEIAKMLVEAAKSQSEEVKRAAHAATKAAEESVKAKEEILSVFPEPKP